MQRIAIKNNLNTEFEIQHKDNEKAISIDSRDLSKVKSVYTLADLQSLTGALPPEARVSGYSEKGDGAFGSLIHEWDPDSAEDAIGGLIVKVNGVEIGRYKLRYDGSINVKWLGAKGDYDYDTDTGTDDTDSFIGAFKFKNIYIPKTDKSYKFQTDSIPSGEGLLTCLEGQNISSNGATLYTTGTANNDNSLLYINNIRDVTIRGINFRNESDFDKTTGASGNIGANHAILLQNTVANRAVNTISITDCSFTAFSSSSIHTTKALVEENTFVYKNIEVSNCKFYKTGSHGVGFNYVHNGRVLGCYGYDIGNVLYDSSTQINSVPGLLVDFSGGCEQCIADSNVVEYFRTGMKSSNVNGGVGVPNNIIFSNNTFRQPKEEGNGYCLQILGDNCTAIGNTIELKGSSTNVIDGILLQADGIGISVTGNSIISSLSSNGRGIQIESHYSGLNTDRNMTISGNTISIQNGIGVNSLSSNDSIAITDNIISSKVRCVSFGGQKSNISNNILNLTSTVNDGCIHFATTSSDFVSYDAVISNNILNVSNSAKGIYFTDVADNTSISCNKIFNAGHNGIQFGTNASNVAINGNVIELVDSTISESQSCIVGGSGNIHDNVSINGNTIKNLSTQSNTDAVRAPLNKSTITGNTIISTTGSSVKLTGTKDYQVLVGNYLVGSVSGVGSNGVSANNATV